jgi:hypothetical protein
MYIVDDPTLALISRFVGGAAYPDLPDAEFFRRQLAAIEAYIERFPVAERETRALAWIAANAQAYRQQWQKQAAIDVLASSRCLDCPLTGVDQRAPCAIHERWLTLLQSYAASELSSHEYIAQSLALLTAFKDGLRVRHARQAPLYARPEPDDHPAAGSTCRPDPPGSRPTLPAQTVHS